MDTIIQDQPITPVAALPQSKKNKQVSVIIIIIVAFVSGIIGYFLGRPSQNLPSSSVVSNTPVSPTIAIPSPPSTDISITTENIDNFISYKMPEGWKIGNDPSGENSFTIVSPDYKWETSAPFPTAGASINIIVESESLNTFIDGYIDEVTKESNQSVKTKKRTTIAGFQGYSSYDAFDRYSYTLIEIKNGAILQWHFTLSTRKSQYESTLDTFVQSIRFK